MGSSGYFIVMDGTRRNTMEKGLQLRQMVEKTIGEVPFVVLVNKADLKPQWEITDDDLARLKAEGVTLMLTSAKTGEGVEEAFTYLARKIAE